MNTSILAFQLLQATSTALCNPVVLQKMTDTSSPTLLQAVFAGTHLSAAKIVYLKTLGGVQVVLTSLTLTDVVIGSINTSDIRTNTNPQDILETVSLVWKQFQYAYYTYDTATGVATPHYATWNGETNSAT